MTKRAIDPQPLETRMSDEKIEALIQAKGKTAPRVTPDHIDSTIDSIHFFTAADGVYGVERDTCTLPPPAPLELLTFCVLVLRNGFTVTGQSACASPENFDADIGRDIAFRNAREKIWPLEGYLLRERLEHGA
jgi:hypothetical protein